VGLSLAETLECLRAHSPSAVQLAGQDGTVFVCPELQGRIFCSLGDELIHRLDVDLLAKPSQTEFNNLGGNSLWPAPEGGAFAFNYRQDSDDWYVQPLVGDAAATIVDASAGQALIEKRGALTNKAAVTASVTMRRKVALAHDHPVPEGFSLKGIRYFCEDALAPNEELNAERFLIAPWSLEQFPGGDGIVAFGAAATPQGCVNDDYYGVPGERIQFHEGGFTFALGGSDRHQIGIRVAHAPRLIGSLDPERNLLILRKTAEQGGRYFNIADNEQPQGAWSARDLFSVFNGGDLGFYELETIGALQTCNGLVAPSLLQSETLILEGPMHELKRYLRERENITFMETF
jgi:hypothetical protein